MEQKALNEQQKKLAQDQKVPSYNQELNTEKNWPKVEQSAPAKSVGKRKGSKLLRISGYLALGA